MVLKHSSIKLESKFHQVTAILLSLEREFEHCQRGLEDLGGDDQVGSGIQFFLDKKKELESWEVRYRKAAEIKSIQINFN